MQTGKHKHFDDWPEILTSKDLALINKIVDAM